MTEWAEMRKKVSKRLSNQILSVEWHIRICKKETAITRFTHKECCTVTSYRIRKVGFQGIGGTTLDCIIWSLVSSFTHI